LGSDSVSDRYLALLRIWNSETLRSDDRIRLALFSELDRFNRALLQRYYQWGRGGRASPEDEYPTEFGLDILELVLRLHDERAIPVIVESTAVGGTTAEVLAEWGDTALPAVLAAWHGRAERPELGVQALRDGVLRTMTLMIENDTVGAPGRTEILSVAREALERPAGSTDLQMAIRLSIALDDADLVAAVERIAEDVVEVLSRVNDRDQVESIQRTARESLAGVDRR
jgi:hypothetical protein